ncbi:MAG TPA: hypothetical protein VL970_14015 [Candidatus Acidoferrales bacterium]|nr:hypothetical protein [Candidatus Acidoferrales bacterium]
MLNGSVRCLVFGLLGLLPLIGLPFALAALWLAGRVRRQEKRFWNAAKPYRIIGVTCAAMGTIGWLLIVGIIMLNAAMQG